LSRPVHDNGRHSLLLQLSGTIPIYYKGSQYNIPVVIWLLETYPAIPPKCYVTPTAGTLWLIFNGAACLTLLSAVLFTLLTPLIAQTCECRSGIVT